MRFLDGGRCVLIGYARVSTDDQSLNLQNDALDAAGCQDIYRDKASCAKAERPGLREALAALRKSDTLIVWRLDRLRRSLKDLISIAEALCAELERILQLTKAASGRRAAALR